jgi:hypothetical protein
MIVGMGNNGTLVIAVTKADVEHLQSGQVGTPYGETLAYEGATPIGLVQNVIMLYADDKEALIRIFKESGVDANAKTVPGWADKVRRGERTDKPKKAN